MDRGVQIESDNSILVWRRNCHLRRSHVAPKVRAFLDSAVKTLRDIDGIR